jgi:hypothetical protein
MSASLWFLLGALSAALLIAAACWLHARWEAVEDLLEYRTANGPLIERQSQALTTTIRRPAPVERQHAWAELDEIRDLWRRSPHLRRVK